MRELTTDASLVAACGLYCGACRSYLREKCPGCRAHGEGHWCKILKCTRAKGIDTCAACDQFADPRDCRTVNNFVSKIFALLFGSDRYACLAAIREKGMAGHAADMAALGKVSLARKKG